MARFFKIEELQARKRALVAESEVYRQTLGLEIQNLRLYSVQLQRKLSRFAPSNPLWLLAAPLAGLLLRGRRRGWRGMIGTALLGWRVYKRVRPILSMLFKRSSPDKADHPANSEEQASGASA